MAVKYTYKKRLTLARLAIPATGRKCWGHKGDTTSRPAPMSYITSAVHCTHRKTHLLLHNHTASATMDYWFTYSVLNLRALAPTRRGCIPNMRQRFGSESMRAPMLLHTSFPICCIPSFSTCPFIDPSSQNIINLSLPTRGLSSPTTTLSQPHPDLFMSLKHGLGCSRSTSML
jgi:hypothetical protein